MQTEETISGGPDWSAVSSATARVATLALLDAFGVQRRWHAHSDAEHRVRSAILRHYARAGCAPDSPSLRSLAALPAAKVEGALAALAARDLVVLAEGRIVGAYPFTDRVTEHRVAIDGRLVHAMCAIDALGVGAMFGQDVAIDSRCRACGAGVRVTTRDRGRALGAVSPTDAVVWSGAGDREGCAADSLCTVIAFFCSGAHLEAWVAANALGTGGFRLAMSEALEVGRALFGPVLDRAGNAQGAT